MRIRLVVVVPVLSMVALGAALDFNAIPRPPLSRDPMELVTGDAQPVQDAEQRIAALGLLDRAHALSNVRAQPYALRTSFTAHGGLASDGNWVLEDVAPQGGGYRWTAQGPNYSAINLYPRSSGNALYGNQPSGRLPLRLIQVRSALFFAIPKVGSQASVRTATGNLNGVGQSCVLVVIGAGRRTFAGTRNWEESEYCVDAQTGLLSQYSPAPGLFIRYDYTSAIRFHDKIIPTGFSISENGKVVVEARTVGLTDPPVRTDAMFDTAGLTPLGAGRAMNPRWNTALTIPVPREPFPTSNASAAMHAVTLHGNRAGDGTLSEVEILATSDPGLNEAAVTQAKAFALRLPGSQPGATVQSTELILTFEFVTIAR